MTLAVAPDAAFDCRWYDVEAPGWTDHETPVEAPPIRLASPGAGQWVAVLSRES